MAVPRIGQTPPSTAATRGWIVCDRDRSRDILRADAHQDSGLLYSGSGERDVVEVQVSPQQRALAERVRCARAMLRPDMGR